MSYEAVVSSVAERLGDLLIQEAKLLHGVHDQVRRIQMELDRMRCFLNDAESEQEENPRARNWLVHIRDVCYDAEDVLDTFILSQKAKKKDGFEGHVKRYICILCELIDRQKVARQIKKILLRIIDISRSAETYGINVFHEIGASSSRHSLQERRRMSTAYEVSEVVGLEDEVNHVKKQLMTGEQRRCVISIFGMGGLGKTTLAKKVYHDVKKQFDCHAFIYLSQQFAIKDVLIRIIKGVMSPSKVEIEEIKKKDLEELSRMLHGDLKEKRYLVVIDDVWSIEDWEKINRMLPDGMKESRVMLTTRNEEVALHADPRHPHKMRFLHGEEGWELFMKKIFPGDPLTACPSELQKIGRKILEKCGGLPLPILVLGGLLSGRDKTEHAWSRVLNRVNWHLNESSEQCWKILALSYWDLPYYLKPCFLYLGLFPEDSKISSGKLIRLWIAEGFIQQKGDDLMEDVAEDYLEELVRRSMIQVTSRKSNGSVGKCRLHNLLREFSLSEARQNNFFAIDNDNDTCLSLTSVRRFAFYHCVDEYKINAKATSLRSIFCFAGSKVSLSRLLNIGSKLLLRVLVIEGAEGQSFKEVSACVHLRYLELAGMKDGSLPSIGSLSNLQTLKLSFGGTLPNAIWNLAHLRHLSCSGHKTDEHPKLKKLGNLQTLKLSAGSWIGDGLGKLSNLRKLGIRGDLSSHHKALSDSIDKLYNLQSLKLHDGHSIPPFEFSNHARLYKMYLDGKIVQLPRLPPDLTELTLQRSLLGPDAISTLGKLPHLKILRLLHESYVGKRVICSEGGFPCLELLRLSELPLERLDVKEGQMKSLKSVELFGMSKLETEALPKGVHSILKYI